MQLNAEEMTKTALFTGLAVITAVLARFGGHLVPFTMLPLVVMLAGTLIGPRLAAISMLLYTLLGLVGLPVFASPPFGGLAYLLQPSFGFIPGFILGAYIVGSLLKRIENRSYYTYLAASLNGLVAIYLCGLPYMWLVLNLHLGEAVDIWSLLRLGLLPFLLPDLIKAAVAAGIARAVALRLPGWTQI